jgi:DNA-directed RNA polymerase subunit alpha
VKEDVTQIVLNVKKLRLKSYAPHPVQLKLVKSGAGVVTAADITENADVEIVNPEQHLMVLDSGDVTIEVDLTVERGVGYLAAERAEPLPIGVIPIDAIFTPVRKINYTVENTRVGQMTNYDKLVLEVWTDGSLTAIDAVSRSGDILRDELTLFSRLGKPESAVVEHGVGRGLALPPDKYNTPIEDLNLSVRAYNCLKRSGLMTVGQVLEKSEEELLTLRNFGQKSYDELKAKLVELDYLAPGEREERREPMPGDEDYSPLGAALIQALQEAGEDPSELLKGSVDDNNGVNGDRDFAP